MSGQSTTDDENDEHGDPVSSNNSAIGPSAEGTPFDSIPNAQHVFSATTTFTAETETAPENIGDGGFKLEADSKDEHDHHQDDDDDETAHGNFNVDIDAPILDAAEVVVIDIPSGTANLKGGDFVDDENDTQYVILTDDGNLETVHFSGWGKDDPSNPDEGPGGDDQFHIDLHLFDDDFNITLASMDEGDTFFFTNVDSYTVESDPEDDVLVYTIHYTGSDDQPHTVIIDLFSAVTNEFVGIDITLACFAKGTLIETNAGPCAVEHLNLGDSILCGDGKNRPIQWIASRHIDGAELNKHPQYRPIRIKKDGLGVNRPSRDLVVSPQHRILVGDSQVNLMFGAEDVLIPAKFLINGGSIDADSMAKHVTYYHFMFDSHQTVISEGTQTESFHPGDMALGGMNDDLRDEIFALFPDLKSNPQNFGATCLPVLKSFEATALLGAGG